MIFNIQIDSIISSSGIEVKGLELLDNQPSISSLSDIDEFSSDKIHRFWMNSQNIKKLNVTGSEPFPSKFLKPSSDNIIISSEMLDLMIEYYNATYRILPKISTPFYYRDAYFRVIHVIYIKLRQILSDDHHIISVNETRNLF